MGENTLSSATQEIGTAYMDYLELERDPNMLVRLHAIHPGDMLHVTSFARDNTVRTFQFAIASRGWHRLSRTGLQPPVPTLTGILHGEKMRPQFPGQSYELNGTTPSPGSYNPGLRRGEKLECFSEELGRHLDLGIVDDAYLIKGAGAATLQLTPVAAETQVLPMQQPHDERLQRAQSLLNLPFSGTLWHHEKGMLEAPPAASWSFAEAHDASDHTISYTYESEACTADYRPGTPNVLTVFDKSAQQRLEFIYHPQQDILQTSIINLAHLADPAHPSAKDLIEASAWTLVTSPTQGIDAVEYVPSPDEMKMLNVEVRPYIQRWADGALRVAGQPELEDRLRALQQDTKYLWLTELHNRSVPNPQHTYDFIH